MNTLENHIVLPSKASVWLYGDTDALVNTQFERVLDSDIGFIRNIWSFGILGSFIFIYPIGKYFCESYRNINKGSMAKILFVVTLIFLFFHLKESFLYTRMFFSIYSLIIALYYFSLKKQQNVF